MFFFLSKILIYFLAPVIWIIIFFIIGLIIKRTRVKRIFFSISLILFLIFSNQFLLNHFAKMWDVKQTTLHTDAKYSAAIVLGGYSSEDAEQDGYFNIAADRFIEAIKLKTEGKVTHLLISGGSGKLYPTDFRESDWVLTQLKDLKIPDSSILVENRSRNSYENALFSKNILDSVMLKPPYILVTSAYHMRRAQYIYKQKGLDVIPYPCNYIAGRSKTSFTDFIPSAGTLSDWEIYIKEMVGYAMYAVFKN